MIEVRFVVDETGGIRSVYERHWLDDPDEGDVSEGLRPLCCVVAGLLVTASRDWPGESLEYLAGKLLGELATASTWDDEQKRQDAIALARRLMETQDGH